MAHLLTPPAIIAPVSASVDGKKTTLLSFPCFPKKPNSHKDFNPAKDAAFIDRRSLIWSMTLAATTMGLSQSAHAAQKRPPPKAPKEKTDPNVSGVQAKVLASMKRKEAMKEAVAKLKKKGKPVDDSLRE